MATLAVAWTLANPAITSPIVGASRPEQLKASVAAVDLALDPALKARLDGQKDATVSLHCDKTVAVDEVVKVMNIAKDNNYKLILATSPK
jgi:biopolymer transport protein ExbD